MQNWNAILYLWYVILFTVMFWTYNIRLEDKSMIEKMFKSLMENHEMNHIEYKIFNSIQDPANKKTEEHYTNLQGKVAEAVSDDEIVLMVSARYDFVVKVVDHLTSVMMTYIILFSPDFVQLENKKIVEKIQVLNTYMYPLWMTIHLCPCFSSITWNSWRNIFTPPSPKKREEAGEEKISFTVQFIQTLYVHYY